MLTKLLAVTGFFAAWIGVAVVIDPLLAATGGPEPAPPPQAGAPMEVCTAPDVQLEFLQKRFGETVAFIGKTSQGEVTITTNEKTGSWTALSSNGPVMCAMAAGPEHKIIPQGADL